MSIFALPLLLCLLHQIANVASGSDMIVPYACVDHNNPVLMSTLSPSPYFMHKHETANCSLSMITEKKTCHSPFVKKQEVPCFNGYIEWLPPLTGWYMRGNETANLGLVYNTNLTTCQRACIDTSGCKVAILRYNGECILMNTGYEIIPHDEMILMTYRCCKPHFSDANKFSYSLKMRRDAQNVIYSWQSRPLLCSPSGEFVMNWNNLPGYNWLTIWQVMINGSFGNLHTFIMLPEQGKGVTVWMQFARSRSGGLLQALYSVDTPRSVKPMTIWYEVKLIYYKRKGGREIVSHPRRRATLSKYFHVDLFRTGTLNWKEMKSDELPTIIFKLHQVEKENRI